jgi:integrase
MKRDPRDHHVTHLGDGRHRIRFEVGFDPESGRPLAISRNFRGTVAEAREYRDWLTRQFGSPEAILYGRMMVADFVAQEWLEPRREKLAETTLRGYDATLKNHIRPHFSRLRLKDVKPLHISKALASIKHPGAALNAHKMLTAAFAFAADNDILTPSPMHRVARPEIPDYEADVYCLEEVLDAFYAVRGLDFEPGILIAASCGTRASETCALDWQDVELDSDSRTGSVAITEGYHRLPGKRITTPPKTRRSKRVLAIPGFVVERLLEIRGDGRIGPLMTDRTGQRTTPGGFSQRWRRLTTERRDKAGRVIYAPPVRHIELKNLRHSQSTILLDLGATMHEVSLRAGHSRESTTDRFYNKANRVAADHSVAKRLDAAVSGTKRDRIGQMKRAAGGEVVHITQEQDST